MKKKEVSVSGDNEATQSFEQTGHLLNEENYNEVYENILQKLMETDEYEKLRVWTSDVETRDVYLTAKKTSPAWKKVIMRKTVDVDAREKPHCLHSCIQPIPPLPWRIIHTVGWFLQPCSQVPRFTCFWRKLTDDIAIWCITFPLKERSLEINVADGPTIGSCILAKKSQTQSGRCWAIRLLSIFLTVLKSAKHPSGLAFLELAISIPFNG